MKTLSQSKRGFTLLEILLVVAALGILAGIVILAINPAKQIAQTNNAVRRADVNTILTAAYQYIIDNDGSLPSEITTTSTPICPTGDDDDSCIDLAVLTDDETYLSSMPTDPTANGENDAGYNIFKTANNRITVTAPNAQNEATISVTR